MVKYIVFVIMIFPLTFTGCGDDDGGGGNGNNSADREAPRHPKSARWEWALSGRSVREDIHTCALSATGGVQCWGSGNNGKLGNNATTTLKLPGDPVVDSGSDPLTGHCSSRVQDLSHSCALDSEGGVWCWGKGSQSVAWAMTHPADSDHAVAVVDGDSSSHTALTGIVQIGGSS